MGRNRIIILVITVLSAIYLGEFSLNANNRYGLLKKENSNTSKLDRKIEQQLIVPKGQWTVGFNFMYNHIKSNNFNVVVIDNANLEGYTLKVSPFFLYTFKNNMAYGARFGYERSLVKINNIDFALDSDTKFSMGDLYKLNHNYIGTLLFRQYINIGSLKRFAFFADSQLSLSGSQSKILNGRGENLIGTYETSFNAGLGITPGIVAFIDNKTAIEVSVGLLGVNYSVIYQNNNQIHRAKRTSSKGNFLVNIFSIGFGISWYI